MAVAPGASFLRHAHTPPASFVTVRGGIDFFSVTLLWCTLKYCSGSNENNFMYTGIK
jgi:hypothetical protein